MKSILIKLAVAITLLFGVTTWSYAGNKMSDGYTMKEGKMMVTKSGDTEPMTKDVTLANGTKVMKDGTVVMKDGEKVMLKDGECVCAEGKITSVEKTTGDSSSTSKTKQP